MACAVFPPSLLQKRQSIGRRRTRMSRRSCSYLLHFDVGRVAQSLVYTLCIVATATHKSCVLEATPCRLQMRSVLFNTLRPAKSEPLKGETATGGTSWAAPRRSTEHAVVPLLTHPFLGAGYYISARLVAVLPPANECYIVLPRVSEATVRSAPHDARGFYAQAIPNLALITKTMQRL